MAKLRTPTEVCVEYALAVAAVREQSRILASNFCTEANDKFGLTTGETECLTEYWHRIEGPDGPVSRSQIEYDDMCDNCKKREAAVRDRREARKRLGAAKRAVEVVGKRENKLEVRG